MNLPLCCGKPLSFSRRYYFCEECGAKFVTDHNGALVRVWNS